MALTKPARVTVIPGIPAVPGQPASEVCSPKPPPVDSGDNALPEPPPPGGSGPAPGTPILLDEPGQPLVESVAPAPAGWTCRQETVFITVPGQVFPIAQVFIVCSP